MMMMMVGWQGGGVGGRIYDDADDEEVAVIREGHRVELRQQGDRAGQQPHCDLQIAQTHVLTVTPLEDDLTWEGFARAEILSCSR